MISLSTNGSRRWRLSISVTRTPSAANMLAYSRPMTPAPTTVSVRGSCVQPQNVVAAADALPIEGDVRVARGFGAGGDHDLAGGDVTHRARAVLVDVGQADGVRIDERRLGGEHLDLVAHQLVARDVDLVAHDVIGAEQQILHGDVLLDRVRRAVQTAQPIARQMQDRLAQGLARNRAGVDAHAADDRLALDDARRAC